MEIRLLRVDDDRRDFTSGELDIDRFFSAFAGQNQFKHHIGVTYVAADGGKLIGFATVVASTLEPESLPAAARKKLPDYPAPVLRLGRLGVDQRAQGQGVGTALLRYVIGLALKMAAELGCIGVVIDAKPAAVEFYGRHGFVALDTLEGATETYPRATPMFLSIHTIKRAAKISRGEGT